MSEDNKALIVPNEQTDLSAEELAGVAEFVEKGLPGISAVDEVKMARVTEMYLSGKTYRQIAKATRLDKNIILYLSHKFDWYKTKQEYFNELEHNLKERYVETKIVSQNFLNDLMNFWHKRIGNNVTKFLTAGDTDAAESINGKDIDRYLKTLEVLHKLSTEKGATGARSGGSSPTVGLNVGEGVTVRKVGDNEVEITPKNKTIGEMLKSFADFRRQEENPEKPVDKSDIKEVSSNKGENNES